MRSTVVIFGVASLLLSTASFADLDLAKKSGCLACHSVEKKVVGPAWKDVAAKYKGDAGAKAALVAKVKLDRLSIPWDWSTVSNESAHKLVEALELET